MAEEVCKLKETLNEDTASIALLDTGSTFNSTNDKNKLADTGKAKQPIMSRANVGKWLMENHGETPCLTDQMW